jgi:hypothetical protein
MSLPETLLFPSLIAVMLREPSEDKLLLMMEEFQVSAALVGNSVLNDEMPYQVKNSAHQ